MNIRHAGALALVGWYLLVPPINHNTKSIDSKAPITAWTVLNKFGTDKECKKGMSDHDALIEEVSESGYAREGKLQTELLSKAQCIDENDHRFKGWEGAFIGRIR
ncbi:MAG TPA: hypothetical protein VJX68_01620 [Candidatus Binatus sp.]|uniref:hypothetical protein n=1 Tax=Candidatus Binatus sp. TaxID=2811406 RepID=UPI002B45D1D5|nr:hypothetical protein [Candidatus Binatus sp.]HKN11869.1 hypothetical protein [Candidatus Binatus sp.]